MSKINAFSLESIGSKNEMLFFVQGQNNPKIFFKIEPFKEDLIAKAEYTLPDGFIVYNFGVMKKNEKYYEFGIPTEAVNQTGVHYVKFTLFNTEQTKRYTVPNRCYYTVTREENYTENTFVSQNAIDVVVDLLGNLSSEKISAEELLSSILVELNDEGIKQVQNVVEKGNEERNSVIKEGGYQAGIVNQAGDFYSKIVSDTATREVQIAKVAIEEEGVYQLSKLREYAAGEGYGKFVEFLGGYSAEEFFLETEFEDYLVALIGDRYKGRTELEFPGDVVFIDDYISISVGTDALSDPILSAEVLSEKLRKLIQLRGEEKINFQLNKFNDNTIVGFEFVTGSQLQSDNYTIGFSIHRDIRAISIEIPSNGTVTCTPEYKEIISSSPIALDYRTDYTPIHHVTETKLKSYSY